MSVLPMRAPLHWATLLCLFACGGNTEGTSRGDSPATGTDASVLGDAAAPSSGDGDGESGDGDSGDGDARGDAGPSEPTPPGGDAGGGPSEEPEPACGELAWAPGESTKVELEHGGLARSYVAYVGKNVDPSQRVPLLVNVHGLRNSPNLQALFSGMNPQADARNVIVVYPQGIEASFNAGTCCGPAGEQGIDDVGFMLAIVADAKSKACIDRKRVYATGFSNGGFMANTLGCAAADTFAAVASVGGASGAISCNPGRPVPFFGLNAPPDTIVRFDDGRNATLDWVERNGCAETPARTDYGTSFCEVWSECTGGVEVQFCTWVGGLHFWPTSPLPASDMIWEFFDRFPMP